MDRHIKVSQVMNVVTDQLEEAATGVFVAETEEERSEYMIRSQCLRGVVFGIVQLLPEGKRERVMDKIRNQYRTLATSLALEV